MNKFRTILLAVLALTMLLGSAAVFADAETPLVVGYSPFSQKFSPFYADTAYDQDVVSMVQLSLMTTDRVGAIIYNGIEGETISYNGTDYTYYGPADLTVEYDEAADITTYTAKLRDDLVFSDGEKLTADDIIFTYYVYLDPAYVGSTTLSSYNIIGLKDYQTQTTSDVYDKYYAIAQSIIEADGEVPEGVDPEQVEFFWNARDSYWKAVCQAIVNYCVANYPSYIDGFGYTEADLAENEGLQVAFGMAMWGFGDIADGVFTDSDGNEFNMNEGVYPTIDDYYAATFNAYGGDAETFYGTESTGGSEKNVLPASVDDFISHFAASEPELAGGIPNISGIEKIDDYTVSVKVRGFEAPAVYSILGIQIAPLHYYGDPAQYNYEANQFGHPFGDLSLVESKTTAPMGAGPYKFIEYKDKVVYFEANESYYKGAPKTKYVQFKEVVSAEVAAGVKVGTIDAGEMTGSKTRFEELMSYNSNGELDGDVIFTSKVDNLGYGYIGINADTVNVGGESGSDASKALRKGLATILAVYRETAFDSYYGEAASVIQYPISNTSWAAPQATDEGFKIAFSVDPDGNDIYTADMTAEEKYAAAKAAALKWFEVAGYTVEDGKLTAAPEGAKLVYEAIIPGDGTGDHPSFAVLTDAAATLAEIGMTLNINDPADSNILWDALDSGNQELWCAAWGSTIDPDMYQVYHSSGVVGEGGSDSNHYHLRDAELDKLIVEARQSADQSFRKSVYKQALDIVVDWAVEIPAYQRQNIIIFSPERINMDTMTPDITTFYGWMSEVENIEMN
ncbi:MAG: hypothetical protein IJI07_03265 [Flexilinea sp.]|nr:hypothetical protein [Flexilinea sp.]